METAMMVITVIGLLAFTVVSVVVIFKVLKA